MSNLVIQIFKKLFYDFLKPENLIGADKKFSKK